MNNTKELSVSKNTPSDKKTEQIVLENEQALKDYILGNMHKIISGDMDIKTVVKSIMSEYLNLEEQAEFMNDSRVLAALNIADAAVKSYNDTKQFKKENNDGGGLGDFSIDKLLKGGI